MTMLFDNSPRLDAAESVFFKRQLEAIDRELYQVQYPIMKARQLIPTQQGIPDWARTYTWRMFDKVGKAKFIGNNPKDLPRVSVLGGEQTKMIKPCGDAY